MQANEDKKKMLMVTSKDTAMIVTVMIMAAEGSDGPEIADELIKTFSIGLSDAASMVTFTIALTEKSYDKLQEIKNKAIGLDGRRNAKKA